MSCFAGKVAVITGAGSGIGRALAQQLAAKGARLALSDVNAAGLEETMVSLPAGCDARSYALDVSNRRAVFDHADAVQRDFGTAHFVINNAGVTVVGTIAHLTIEEIEWQLGINLWGVIYGTKAFLPMMLAQREGCIVNISSVFGLVAFPTQGAYNISKFGVRGLTECLWNELDGTGVRAVCVHPGGIRTNIEKAGRRCAAAGADEATLRRAWRKTADHAARRLRGRHPHRDRARQEARHHRSQVHVAVVVEPPPAQPLSRRAQGDGEIAVHAMRRRKMGCPVSHIYVAGIAMTVFGRHIERSLHDLAGEALQGALKDAGCQAGDIGVAYYSGMTNGPLQGQISIPGQVVFSKIGIEGIPVYNVENACASGSSGVQSGVAEPEGGHRGRRARDRRREDEHPRQGEGLRHLRRRLGRLARRGELRRP